MPTTSVWVSAARCRSNEARARARSCGSTAGSTTTRGRAGTAIAGLAERTASASVVDLAVVATSPAQTPAPSNCLRDSSTGNPSAMAIPYRKGLANFECIEGVNESFAISVQRESGTAGGGLDDGTELTPLPEGRGWGWVPAKPAETRSQ